MPVNKKRSPTLLSMIRNFLQDSRSVGALLLGCTIISLVIANTTAGNNYIALINFSFHLPGGLQLPHTLLHWINDGAMALFFFLVGMEIKKELLAGELSDFKKAVLPLAAATGGMLVPALLFICFNHGSEYENGWGIPMATDIAFSLGVASLLGSRVPVALKIFLMALAIIDDLGAILVIAIFYGSGLHIPWLLFSAGLVAALFLLRLFKKNMPVARIILSILLWWAVFNSGIHATIAGVIAALFVPLDKLETYEHALHHLVNFVVLPVFALANTAIVFPASLAEPFTTRLSWGILAGLAAGKPIGITLFSWIMVKLGIGKMPTGSNWKQIAGAGVLAGIGFTMSIFITLLAFTDPLFRDIAKLAVLLASVLSIIAGLIILRLAAPAKNV
ncbi:MAG TPA: Na+/H+ antiporter NhaA [Chitinophagaceae bacterium]